MRKRTASRRWLVRRFLTAVALPLLIAGLGATQTHAQATAQEADERVPDIIIFTHITCPYCADAKVYLEDLQQRKPGLKVWVRELTEDRAASSDLRDIGRNVGVPNPGLPAWVVGGQVFLVGFGGPATTGRQIEDLLADMGLPPQAQRVGGDEAAPAPAPPARDAETRSPEEPGADQPARDDDREEESAAPGLQIRTATPTTISLPFIGEVDAAGMSLPALTGLIAFVDGFNPCSLWVLTFLLGIVLYSGSRRKVLLVGGLFLLVTASAYGLFIVGMFGTLRYLAYLSWITFAVAGMALIFALVNIKDYFWFQKGVSFTISDKHKPKLFERARNLMHPGRSLPALLIGTVVLALGITLVELPCTAGFPMVWTGIIATHGIPLSYFGALLALYISVYLLIELVIFGSVVVTMKRSTFEEKHGRILKLFGGMIMLALGLTLIFAPDTMHSLGGTLVVFGSALAASVAILWLHRRVLPRFGIVIGSEDLQVAD